MHTTIHTGAVAFAQFYIPMMDMVTYSDVLKECSRLVPCLSKACTVLVINWYKLVMI